jgi:hypothetical protein
MESIRIRRSLEAAGRWTGLPLWCAVVLLLGAGHATPAGAVSFQLDIAASTYQVVAGDTWADLIAQHQSETLLSSTNVTTVAGVSAPLYAGVNQNYSMLIETVLDVTATGTYDFQVGTDWGRGGVAVVIDNGTGSVIDELVRTDDIWWNNSWTNPDVFVTSVALTAGQSYTVAWLGFEDCCGGGAEVRFAYDGAPFQTLGETSIAPYATPEPASALLLGMGLALLGCGRRWPRADALRA